MFLPVSFGGLTAVLSAVGYIKVILKGRHTAQEIGLAAIRRSREAGIENGTIHRIRRTVSSILNQDLPQKAVAEMLGHTETVNEMCYNYSIAEISEKANALSRLSGIINVNEATNGEN